MKKGHHLSSGDPVFCPYQERRDWLSHSSSIASTSSLGRIERS